MYFEYPKILFLLLILAPIVAHYIWRAIRGITPSLQVSSLAAFSKAGTGLRHYFKHIPFAIRCLSLALLILAIARPRSSEAFNKTDTEGIDIIFALDISTSMLARDFKPDRINAAKDIAIRFISERPMNIFAPSRNDLAGRSTTLVGPDPLRRRFSQRFLYATGDRLRLHRRCEVNDKRPGC